MAEKEKKFTFKNYLKELKKSWLLLVIFVLIGAVAGSVYAFRKPTEYISSAKFSVHNSSIDNGSTTSPYSQIGALVQSKDLIVRNSDVKESDFSKVEVMEKTFGVFDIVVTSATAEQAKNTMSGILGSIRIIMDEAFDDAGYYQITILQNANEATPTFTTGKRILTTAIIAFGMLVLAMIVVFVKFDYSSN